MAIRTLQKKNLETERISQTEHVIPDDRTLPPSVQSQEESKVNDEKMRDWSLQGVQGNLNPNSKQANNVLVE